MTSSNVAIVVFAVLCCNVQVYSVKYAKKFFRFQNEVLITGEKYLNNTTLTFALCQYGSGQKNATCLVRHEKDVFSSEYEGRACEVKIMAEDTTTKIELIGAELWGKNKAILIWRDYNDRNPVRSNVTLQTFKMQSCDTKVHKVAVDNGNDMSSQMAIVSYEDNFIIAFKHSQLCPNYYCKKIVNEAGETSDSESWFPPLGTLFDMGNIQDSENILVLFGGHSLIDFGQIKYFLLWSTGFRELDRNYINDNFAWSTKNGGILFCTNFHCKQYNSDGLLENTINLNLDYEIEEIVDVLTVQGGGILAVLCTTEPNTYFRFAQIGIDGQESYFHELIDIPCTTGAEHMYSQLYLKDDGKYCVSVFISIDGSPSTTSLRQYCFTLEDMSTGSRMNE